MYECTIYSVYLRMYFYYKTVSICSFFHIMYISIHVSTYVCQRILLTSIIATYTVSLCFQDEDILKDWKAGKKARWPRLPELRFKIGDRFDSYFGIDRHERF